MNRRTSGLTVTQAAEGFIKYKVVEGLSPRTLATYAGYLRALAAFVGDQPVSRVTSVFFSNDIQQPTRLA